MPDVTNPCVPADNRLCNQGAVLRGSKHSSSSLLCSPAFSNLDPPGWTGRPRYVNPSGRMTSDPSRCRTLIVYLSSGVLSRKPPKSGNCTGEEVGRAMNGPQFARVRQAVRSGLRGPAHSVNSFGSPPMLITFHVFTGTTTQRFDFSFLRDMFMGPVKTQCIFLLSEITATETSASTRASSP